VSYHAEDASGNIAVCTFSVVIRDSESPVMENCSTGISATTDPDSDHATVYFQVPVATDNVGVASETTTHTSGASYPVGVTYFSATAVDTSGNTATCSFEITVSDAQAPTIYDCIDGTYTAYAALDSNSVSVIWPAVSAEDNVDGVIAVTSTHESGQVFSVGAESVLITAVDFAGNTAHCTFVVEVLDIQAPDLINCPLSEYMATTNAGEEFGTAIWTVVTAVDAVDGPVEVIASHTVDSVFPLGSTEVSMTTTDASGNTNECTFLVTVEDTEAPTWSCSYDIVLELAEFETGVAVDFYPLPVATDNHVVVNQSQSHESGSWFGLGSFSVQYSAEDAAGNVGYCVFSVDISAQTSPVFANCPISSVSSTEADSDTIVVNYSAVEATGQNNVSIEMTAGLVSGAAFPIGENLQSYVATDDVSGLTATCEFTVTVIDDEAPVFTNCVDLTYPTDANSNVAAVSWVDPIATDNVGVESVSCTLGSDDYAVGTTVITCKATDNAGNTATCDVQVIVVDDEAPVIDNCHVHGFHYELDATETHAVITWAELTATDNVDEEIIWAYSLQKVEALKFLAI
jgi:hypothetical protein